MDIEGFDTKSHVTFDDVKTTIDMYMHRVIEIKAEIELYEYNIKNLEHDEHIMTVAEQSVENSSLREKIKILLQEFNETHALSKKRTALTELYQERKDMLNEIKSLFILGECPSNLCSLCLEHPVDTFLRDCCHTFCSQCLAKLSTNKCPMCRTHYTFTDVKTLIFS